MKNVQSTTTRTVHGGLRPGSGSGAKCAYFINNPKIVNEPSASCPDPTPVYSASHNAFAAGAHASIDDWRSNPPGAGAGRLAAVVGGSTRITTSCAASTSLSVTNGSTVPSRVRGHPSGRDWDRCESRQKRLSRSILMDESQWHRRQALRSIGSDSNIRCLLHPWFAAATLTSALNSNLLMSKMTGPYVRVVFLGEATADRAELKLQIPS